MGVDERKEEKGGRLGGSTIASQQEAVEGEEQEESPWVDAPTEGVGEKIIIRRF